MTVPQIDFPRGDLRTADDDTQRPVAHRAKGGVTSPKAGEAPRADRGPRDELADVILFVLRAASPATREGVLQAGRSIAGSLQKILQTSRLIDNANDRRIAENAIAMLASDDPAAVRKGVKLVAGNERLRGALQAAMPEIAAQG